jgi:hypothetical protein
MMAVDPYATGAVAADGSINYGGGGGYGGLAGAGLALSIGGSVMGAIGTYYSLYGQRNQLKAQALNAEFQATQSAIAARAAALEASQILKAGRMAFAIRGLVEAQDIGATRANAAARGVVVGKGSAGEIEKSQRLAAEIDKRTLRTNSERAAAAARERGANLGAESMLARASAANLRASASTINPALGAAGSALGSSGSILAQWANYNGRR